MAQQISPHVKVPFPNRSWLNGPLNEQIVNIETALLPLGRQDFEIMPRPLNEETAHSEASLLVTPEIARSDAVVPWIKLGLALSVVCCVALYARRRQRSTNGSPSSSERDERPPARSSERWLGWLTLATALLFVFQLQLGIASGSLTLLADLGHTGGDFATYAFGYIMEVAKADLSRRSSVSLRIIALVDMTAASISAAVVVFTSLAAMVSALARLHLHSAQQTDWPETDFRHLGRALILFGCVNIAVNIGLLAMHRYFATDDPSHGSLKAGSSPSPMGPSSSDDAHLICVPCPPEAGIGMAPRRRRQKASKRGVDLLHIAFHPGCSHGSCNHGGCTAPSPSTDDKSEEEEPKTNLNVYGAWLHVATDVLRSLIVFVCGILIEVGILHDAAWADAVCAMFVGSCVILGSATMIRVAVRSMCPT